MRGYRFRLLNGLQAMVWVPKRLRRFILRMAGMTIHPSAFVTEHVEFTWNEVDVGEGAFVNRGVLIDAIERISIGRHVHIAPGTKLLTTSHTVGASGQRAGTAIAMPITIEDGCWIGAGALILPGVTVARGCIVAAGAVVTTSTAPDGVYAGVPARRIRDLGAEARSSPERGGGSAKR